MLAEHDEDLGWYTILYILDNWDYLHRRNFFRSEESIDEWGDKLLANKKHLVED